MGLQGRCRDQLESGDNWNANGFDDANPAHKVPCSDDTVVFPDDKYAIQVHVPMATFAKSVRIQNPDGADPEFVLSATNPDGEMSSAQDLEEYMKLTAGQFEGGTIQLGTLGCGDHCAAFCTNDCGATFSGKIADATAKKAALEQDRRFMHDAAMALLERAEIFKAGVDGMKGTFPRLEKVKSLGVARSTKTLLQDALNDLNKGLPVLGDGTGAPCTMGVDAHESGGADGRGWTKALSSLLALVAGSKTTNTDAIRCTPNAQGVIRCSGFAQVKAQEGKAKSVGLQLARAVKVFFAQLADPAKAADSKASFMPEIAAWGDQPTQLACMFVLPETPRAQIVSTTVEFSYADAEFDLSPLSKNNGGFLTTAECNAIEVSLSFAAASKVHNDFTANKATQADFTEYMTEMFNLLSVWVIGKGNLKWAKIPVGVDDDDASSNKGHPYSPAVFRFTADVEVIGGADYFDVEAVQGPLAIGMFGANAKYNAAGSADKIANAYSTITTTTVRAPVDLDAAKKAAGAQTVDGIGDDVAINDVLTKLTQYQDELVGLQALIKNAQASLAAAEKAKTAACAADFNSATCVASKTALKGALDDIDGFKAKQAVAELKLNLVNASYTDKFNNLSDADKADALASKNAAENEAKKGKTPAELALEVANEAVKNCKTGCDALIAAASAAKKAVDDEKAAAAPAAKESGPGMFLFVAIGAGALVIILCIVIAVMLTGGKRDGGGGGGKNDRNVVAFENPMYDNPGDDAPAAGGYQAEPSYGAPAADDDQDPGLYDEPAFQPEGGKGNPMYSSKDDVAGGNGYLDVAPDDDDDDDEEEESSDDESEEEESSDNDE